MNPRLARWVFGSAIALLVAIAAFCLLPAIAIVLELMRGW